MTHDNDGSVTNSKIIGMTESNLELLFTILADPRSSIVGLHGS